jgi:hypothetical protein
VRGSYAPGRVHIGEERDAAAAIHCGLGGAAASVAWPLPLGAHWGGKTHWLGVPFAVGPIGVEAGQTTARTPRIGYLTLSPLSDKPSPERAAFLQGLRELGYIERESIQIV